ncbi:MAG: ATP-binding protein [Promethearchaeia archaeon]
MTDIKKIFDQIENIGVIGSPSSTSELTVDILGTAVNKGLVGKFSVFNYFQDGKDHYALGQITEILMQNIWTQDATMRGIIRQRGRVDPITEKQDIHTAKMIISSVFSIGNDSVDPSIFGTVPSTGTRIKLFEAKIMDSLLLDYQRELFHLGKIYGTEIFLPMWLKHFDTGKFGLGEAYHIGIFGKTGSGKSFLAKMIITGYARHKNMSIFILDPQGEFSLEFSSNELIKNTYEKKIGRKIKILNLQNLVFDFNELFLMDLLSASGFFHRLRMTFEDHWPRFTEEAIKLLKGGKGTLNEEIKPWNFYKKESFKRLWYQIPKDVFLKNIIFTERPRERVKEVWKSLNFDEMYHIWASITRLFSYKSEENVRLTKLLKETSEGNPLVIIDISSQGKTKEIFWNDQIQLIAIQQFLSKITIQAESKFKEGGNLNSLVVVDEAHRLAPRGRPEIDTISRIKSIFIDAVRTTRKFGLGWMFISQSLSSLDREIINQIRIYIFGFGLGWGVERQALKEIIGGAKEAIRLYQMFKDPQSGLGKREYPFMTIGPISPLSFSGTPLFFNALNYPDEFLKVNFSNKDF